VYIYFPPQDANQQHFFTFFRRKPCFIRTSGIAFVVYKIFGSIQLNTDRKVTKGAVYINESCIKYNYHAGILILHVNYINHNKKKHSVMTSIMKTLVRCLSAHIPVLIAIV